MTPRLPRTRTWWLLAIGTVAVAAAVAAIWRWTPTVETPLEPAWNAVVATIAGTDGGFRDGPSYVARWSDPFGIAVAPDGAIFASDAGQAQRIRKISADGSVVTFAGSVRGFSDGSGSAAQFDTPSALARGSDGTLYVADTGNHAIRRVSPQGQVTTIGGDGLPGDQDGRAARFNGPVGIAVDSHGRIIVADTYNDRIRAIAPDGTVSTLAGGPPGYLDGTGPEAQFDTPCGVAVGTAGQIYVADTGNGVVRVIDPAGNVTTLVSATDGGAVRPVAIAVDRDGSVYVADERGRVVEVTPQGTTRTVAGSLPGFRDGEGADARFRRPGGIAIASPGRLVLADTGNALIRTVTARSRLGLSLPSSPLVAPRFDDAGFASTPLLWPVSPMEGPHEIAGTLGEARGGQGGERFHAGIDVRLDEGTVVRAVRDGAVSAPISAGEFGTLNEWLRIGATTYVHIRVGRTRDGHPVDPARFAASYDETGKIVRVRVRRGTHFSAGDAIATVNGFNHVHLNVGWPGEETNPLRYRLAQFEDTVKPTIAKGGILLFDEAWRPIRRGGRKPVDVSGRVRIVVDAWDQANGNRPNRRLGLYALGYQVLTKSGTPAPGFEQPHDSLTFDRLAMEPEAARIVYAPGSGIPFYGGRRTRFLYVVTNRFHDGVAAEGFWDTTPLAPGLYTLRVRAADIRGNEAAANRDLAVNVRR